MSIVWVEPPNSTYTRWSLIVKDLQNHPRRWALVRENTAVSIASYLRNKYPGIEAKAIMAGRGYAPGRADIYLRWVGESNG